MGYSKKLYRDKIILSIPALLLFGIFIFYPFASGMYLSLTQWDGVGKAEFIGFANYLRLFDDPVARRAIENTFIFAGFNLLIGNPLSLLLGVLLNMPLKSRTFLRTAFYVPSILSLMVISVIWSLILNYDGAINSVLNGMGMGSVAKDWLGTVETALPSIILIGIWQGTGFGAVIYLAGLQSIPQELNEAALIDGAGKWGKFRYVTVPMLMPVITVVTFLGLTSNLKIFDLPYIMTNGGPGTSTITLAIFIYNAAFRNYTWGYAIATGIIFMIIITIITTIQLRITRSKEVSI